MNHLLIFVSCILSFEILFQLNYISLVFSIIKLIKKSTYIILNQNISDHWKEYVIPKYSLTLMGYSFQISLITLFILFILFIGDNLSRGFFRFILSPIGLMEAIFFSFLYFYFRKSFKK